MTNREEVLIFQLLREVSEGNPGPIRWSQVLVPLFLEKMGYVHVDDAGILSNGRPRVLHTFDVLGNKWRKQGILKGDSKKGYWEIKTDHTWWTPTFPDEGESEGEVDSPPPSPPQEDTPDSNDTVWVQEPNEEGDLKDDHLASLLANQTPCFSSWDDSDECRTCLIQGRCAKTTLSAIPQVPHQPIGQLVGYDGSKSIPEDVVQNRVYKAVTVVGTTCSLCKREILKGEKLSFEIFGERRKACQECSSAL